MALTKTQEQIYQACRTIFTGDNAQLRRKEKVKALLEKHKSKLKLLLTRHGMDNVLKMVRILLKKGVFEKRSLARNGQAKLHKSVNNKAMQTPAPKVEESLPEAITVLEVHSQRRSEDCENAAESPKTAGEELENSSTEDELNAYSEVSDDLTNEGPQPNESHTSLLNHSYRADSSIQDLEAGATERPPLTSRNVPRPSPACLPYTTQHKILTNTQTILEKICYTFGNKWLPEVLKERRWTCPEAIELNKFTPELLRARSRTPKKAFNGDRGNLDLALLHAINNIRHAAVHRQHLSAAAVKKLVTSAVRLARKFKDEEWLEKLEQIHSWLKIAVRDLDRNKRLLETVLDREMEEINEERAALDRREQEGLAEMYNSDRLYQADIGSWLDEGMKSILDDSTEVSPHEDTEDPGTDPTDPCGGLGDIERTTP